MVGVAWMLLTGALFVGVTAGVKMVGGRIPAAESAFLRYVLGLVFLIPMLKSLMAANLGRADLTLSAARGLVHGFGVILWFFAMTRIPLAEVTAMNYLVPIYVTLGAALFLSEKLAARRIAAVICGLLGALIILRPGLREVTPGHIAMLGTTLMFAASYLLAKRLADRLPPLAVVALLSITVTIVLAPFALADWVTPNARELGLLFVIATLATGGHFTMTLAFRAAPIAVTQPVTFLQLVWATLLGALAFGEKVDIWVIVGGVLILGSVSFITWREAVLKRRARRIPTDHH
ncbi:DMT family transporter [Oceaniglobus indicus]|uniref:DMT family transporter n=1 Tax=Oceaniglobus indicus TaxID=2047749 RepID=UPI000C1816E6|nr:DMT family transporter [Oceaniglobus indicus]